MPGQTDDPNVIAVGRTKLVGRNNVEVEVDANGNLLTSAGSGGSGGVVTAVDGGLATIGMTTDPSTALTVIGRLKKLLLVLPSALGQLTMANSLSVTMASNQSAIPAAQAAQVSASLSLGTNITTTGGNATVATVDGYNGAQMVEATATGNAGGQAVTFTIEGSYDNANWYTAGCQQVDGIGTPSRTVAGQTITPGAGTTRHVYQVLDLYKYLRVNPSANTLGVGLSATVFAEAV